MFNPANLNSIGPTHGFDRLDIDYCSRIAGRRRIRCATTRIQPKRSSIAVPCRDVVGSRHDGPLRRRSGCEIAFGCQPCRAVIVLDAADIITVRNLTSEIRGYPVHFERDAKAIAHRFHLEHTKMDEGKNVTVGGRPEPMTTSLRVVGGIVVASTLLLSVLLFFFVRSPLGPFHSRELEGLFVRGLLMCMFVAPTGGLYMFLRTRSRWWLLTLLPFTGVLVLWFLISRMVPVTFH